MAPRDYSRSPSRHHHGGLPHQAIMSYNSVRYDVNPGVLRDDHDYNNMYDDVQPPSNYNRDHYQDEDHHDYRPSHRGRDHRGRDNSPSPTRSAIRDAGRPSDTVILENLPRTISAHELRENLLTNSIAADFPEIEVRLSSSRGNRRAFVQFQSIDNAICFVKEHSPSLFFEMPHPTDEMPDGTFEAFLHYARPRDDVDNRALSATNWNCPACDYSNYATRTICKKCGEPKTAFNWQSLTGQADAADVPSQILVVYPLSECINEDILVGDMKRLELEKPSSSKDTSSSAPKLKSTAPTGDASGYGARPGSLHRVFLMRDAHTDESFKYGFVEFWTLEDATAALNKFKMSRAFTVGGLAVTVSTIHMGVFLPEDRPIGPETEHLSFNPLFNPTLRVRYRDLHLYPSMRIVTLSSPISIDRDSTKAAEDEAKKSKKRKADGVLTASVLKKSVPKMSGQMAMWQQKHDEIHSQSNVPSKPGGPALSDANKVPVRTTGSLNKSKSDAKAPIKIALSSSTNFDAGQAPDPEACSKSPDNKVSGYEAAPDTQSTSYVDRNKLMCLICMRKYKSVDEVNIHEKSRNHKTAMCNEELVKAALPRLAVRDKRLLKQAEENETAVESQYRDRAKERRHAHNQSKKVHPQPVTKLNAKPPPKNEVVAHSKALQPSKGAGMLAKMGWKTGAGLGAHADGRTEVIATNAYQEGVGLGAEGGDLGDAAKLAQMRTKNSYAEYVSSVQDKARERLKKMD